MESFELKGNNGFIKFTIIELPEFPNRTHFTGGYDCKINIEIKAGIFTGNGELWSSTGELFQFYSSLKKSYETLEGEINYYNYESNISIHLNFDFSGHCIITGEYYNYSD